MLIKNDPQEARKHLIKNTLTPENVVDIVPMLGYVMVKDMTPKQIDDLQKFADFGHDIGVVPEKVDVQKISAAVLMAIDAPVGRGRAMSRAAGHGADVDAGRRPWRRTPAPHVTIRGLSKRFDKTVIYDNFDLDIPRGELISVFGPNGCGKSTLINMIAGLVPADARANPVRRTAARPRSNSAMCSRIIARRCFPGCAPSTTSPIRSS